jgi:hypothetical protein
MFRERTASIFRAMNKPREKNGVEITESVGLCRILAGPIRGDNNNISDHGGDSHICASIYYFRESHCYKVWEILV